MKIKNFTFDSDTNYQEVEDEIKRGISFLVSESCGCECNECNDCDSICNIFKYLRTADMQRTSNVTRYKKNIEAAYNIIYAVVNG